MLDPLFSYENKHRHRHRRSHENIYMLDIFYVRKSSQQGKTHPTSTIQPDLDLISYEVYSINDF